MRYVSASELARFDYCEMQWAIERRFRLSELTERELRRLVYRGQHASDPDARALGAAAAAYLARVRPAMRRGQRYHSEDARRRVSDPRPVAILLAVLAALALLATALR